jgi:hypothetical protein
VQNGACQPGPARLLGRRRQCNDGVCGESQNHCGKPKRGTVCDDGTACTRADSCSAGICVGRTGHLHRAGSVSSSASATRKPVCSNPAQNDGRPAPTGTAAPRATPARPVPARPARRRLYRRRPVPQRRRCNPSTGQCNDPNSERRRATMPTCSPATAATPGSARPYAHHCAPGDQCHTDGVATDDGLVRAAKPDGTVQRRQRLHAGGHLSGRELHARDAADLLGGRPLQGGRQL